MWSHVLTDTVLAYTLDVCVWKTILQCKYVYADSWLLAKCAEAKAKQVVLPYVNPSMRKKYLNRSSFMVIVKGLQDKTEMRCFFV